MLFDLKQKRKKFFLNLGIVMAALFKCALKLFTVTVINTESEDKTAAITTSYVTEIT